MCPCSESVDWYWALWIKDFIQSSHRTRAQRVSSNWPENRLLMEHGAGMFFSQVCKTNSMSTEPTSPLELGKDRLIKETFTRNTRSPLPRAFPLQTPVPPAVMNTFLSDSQVSESLRRYELSPEPGMESWYERALSPTETLRGDFARDWAPVWRETSQLMSFLLWMWLFSLLGSRRLGNWIMPQHSLSFVYSICFQVHLAYWLYMLSPSIS
jgi:hypothetical protein